MKKRRKFRPKHTVRIRIKSIKVEQQLCQSDFGGKKLNLELRFFRAQRLWAFEFFSLSFRPVLGAVCGIFIILNIKRYIFHYIRVEFWFVKQINAKYWEFFSIPLNYTTIPFSRYERLFEFFIPFIRPHIRSVRNTAYTYTNKSIIKYQWINLCKRWFLRSTLPASFHHLFMNSCVSSEFPICHLRVFCYKAFSVTFVHSKFTFSKIHNNQVWQCPKNYFQNIWKSMAHGSWSFRQT